MQCWQIPQFSVFSPQQVWQDEMIEGLMERQGEEEGEEGEESDGVLLNKRPVLAANKKTLQQRRREQERKMKVHKTYNSRILSQWSRKIKNIGGAKPDQFFY